MNILSCFDGMSCARTDRGILLKDILEYEVDSKYGLSEAGLNRGLTKKYSAPKFDPDKTGTLNTKNNSGQLSIDSGTTFVSVEQKDKSLALTATYGKKTEQDYIKKHQGQMVKLGNVHPSSSGMNGEVYSIEGKAPTLTTNKGEGSKIGLLQVGMASDIKAPTLTANSGGNQETKITGGALRGRLEDGTYVQKFEDNGLEKSNSLTTVDKDSLVTIYPASIIGRKLNQNGKRDDYNPDVPITQCLQVKHSADKTGCLTTVDKDNVVSTMPPGRYEDVYNTPHITYRKLTVTECERLQGVPDGYCRRLSAEKKQVSNSQSYKMLGNGWQVDTIVHLFEPLLWMDII